MRHIKPKPTAFNHAASRLPDTQLVDGPTMANALAISTRSLYRLRRRGIVGFYMIGRSIRFHTAEVFESLQAHHVKSRVQLAASRATRTR